MLDFDRVTTIVVHDNCPDGLASAILLKDAFFGKSIEFLFVQHNTDVHKNLTPRPGVLFADFVPYAETEPVPEDPKKRRLTEAGKAQIQAWVDAGAIVLDHHKTAKDVGIMDFFLAAGQGVYGDEKENPGICGTSLVFEHVWLPRRKELAIQRAFAASFAQLAGIRDTWQRKDPQFREASLQGEVLMFYPRERWMGMTLTDIAARWTTEFRPVGQVLMERQERFIGRLCESPYRMTTTKGTRVVMFDALKAVSDAAEALGEKADLVIGFSYVSDPVFAFTGTTGPNGEAVTGEKFDTGVSQPKLIVSTRSHTGYKCSALASYYGGGGHTAAAGFNVQVEPGDPQPFEHIRQMIEAFENQ